MVTVVVTLWGLEYVVVQKCDEVHAGCDCVHAEYVIHVPVKAVRLRVVLRSRGFLECNSQMHPRAPVRLSRPALNLREASHHRRLGGRLRGVEGSLLELRQRTSWVLYFSVNPNEDRRGND